MVLRLLPICLILYMYNTAFCMIDFTKSHPDYYADTVLVYNDTTLSQVIINDFSDGKITTRYYNNNHILSHIVETILDSNGIYMSQIYYEDGSEIHKETSTFSNNTYNVQSISRLTAISASNDTLYDTSYSYDTTYTLLKRYDYFSGVYLPESVVNKSNVEHYTYLFDTINGNYRIRTISDSSVDTGYFEINPVTLQVIKSYRVLKGGFILLMIYSYIDGKPDNGITILGYRNSLSTILNRYVYKYKNAGIKVYSSKKHCRQAITSTHTIDLLGRKIVYNKPNRSLQRNNSILILKK